MARQVKHQGGIAAYEIQERYESVSDFDRFVIYVIRSSGRGRPGTRLCARDRSHAALTQQRVFTAAFSHGQALRQHAL